MGNLKMKMNWGERNIWKFNISRVKLEYCMLAFSVCNASTWRASKQCLERMWKSLNYPSTVDETIFWKFCWLQLQHFGRVSSLRWEILRLKIVPWWCHKALNIQLGIIWLLDASIICRENLKFKTPCRLVTFILEFWTVLEKRQIFLENFKLFCS